VKIPSSPLKKPLIYLITDRRAFPPHQSIERQLEAIEIAARSGCELIQIRERDLEARELVSFVRTAITLARPYQALVLVNDRLDVALAADADGVQLRSTSLSASDARIIAKVSRHNDFLIGASVHSLKEAKSAINDGADFLVCGPVFDTSSKRQYGPPLGLEKFAEIVGGSETPVLGIGGINCHNAHQVLERGAAGIAAISLFSEPEGIEERVRTILSLELNPSIKYSSPGKES
jgi:thiamine-phosphate pyrophosphorylase